VSTAIIFGANNRVLLWFSISLLILILLYVYLDRIILVFKPTGIYRAYSNFFAFGGNNYRKMYASNESLAVLPDKNMDEKLLQKWTTNVEALVLFNRVCLFVAKRLKTYHDSGVRIVSSIFSVLFLVIFTIFTFAVINLGLFKVDQDFFTYSSNPSFFNFFYYSFNVLVFNQIQEIVAISAASQIILMIEAFFALFLVAILISLVLSVRIQRDTEELNEAIRNLTDEGERIEEFIKDQYKINNIQDAMETLDKLKATFVNLLYKITELLV
jgi:methyl-accepting chemotaxis protein